MHPTSKLNKSSNDLWVGWLWMPLETLQNLPCGRIIGRFSSFMMGCMVLTTSHWDSTLVENVKLFVFYILYLLENKIHKCLECTEFRSGTFCFPSLI